MSRSLIKVADDPLPGQEPPTTVRPAKTHTATRAAVKFASAHCDRRNRRRHHRQRPERRQHQIPQVGGDAPLPLPEVYGHQEPHQRRRGQKASGTARGTRALAAPPPKPHPTRRPERNSQKVRRHRGGRRAAPGSAWVVAVSVTMDSE